MGRKFRTKRAGEIVYNKEKNLLDWIESLIFSFFLATILFAFIIQKAEVDGISMEPNLYENDQLIIYKFLYTPKKSDIIVINPKNYGSPIVKRVVALPGDKVDIDFEKGEFYLNDEIVNEDYIKENMYPPENGSSLTDFPLTLGRNQYFVMGDNRNNSFDSRFELIGVLNKEEVLGRAIFRFWPLDTIGLIK